MQSEIGHDISNGILNLWDMLKKQIKTYANDQEEIKQSII